MQLHVLPFGIQAWDARRRIAGELIEARPGPPHDFRDALWLVPNERSVLSLRALFLDVLKEKRGASGCIPPRISALNRLIDSGAARSSKKPVLDATTRTLAIEEITRSVAGGRKGLGIAPDALAPSIAPLIADALDTVYTHGLTAGTLRELARYSLPASILADVRRAYEAWLERHGLADPAEARASYLPGPDEFGTFTGVVLDGFYDADPVELRVMKALSSAPDFRFVIEADGLNMPGMTEPGMPYFGTDRLLGELGFAPPDAGQSRRDEEAAALSGAIFGGRILSASLADAKKLTPLANDITVTGAINASEESYYVAYSIKQGVLSGEIPDINRVAVFLPEPESYLHMLERALDETGVQRSSGPGMPLVQSPVAAAVLRLLSVAQDGYTFAGIRSTLASPLIRLGTDGNHPEAFARFGRAERITRGRRRWLERLAEPVEDQDDAKLARGPVLRLMELLGKLPDGRAKLDRWCAATKEILDGAAVAEAVAGVTGEGPALTAAFEALTEALDSLEASAARLSSTMTISGYLYVLRKTLALRRFSPGGRRFAGVRLLGGPELLSEPFDVVFAAGLSDGSMPKSYAPELFFTGPASEALGLPGKNEHKTREARRLLSALMCASRVHLVHPETGNRGPVTPSPYIRALRPFVDAGAVGSDSKWCRPSEPAEALSPGDLMRSLSIKSSLPGGPGMEELARLLESLPLDTPGLARATAALLPSTAPKPPTPPDKREFSVTELEEYLLCHYRYYQDKVARSAPVEDPEDDIAPHRAGSVIHEILGRFYETAPGPVTADNSGPELDRLQGIAAMKFGRLPDTQANRELARKFREFLAPRFIETEARLAGSGYELCGFELPVRLEVDDEEAGGFVITGKIDRVELAENGDFVVADYKTGSYPGSGKNLGELFQLPLYAHMLKETKAELSDGRTPDRPVGFVYYNLKDGSMRDVVLYEADAGIVDSETKPKRKAGPDVIEGRVEEAFNTAVDAVRGIIKGEFEPSCDKPLLCDRCVYIEVCDKGSRLDDDGGSENEAGSDED